MGVAVGDGRRGSAVAAAGLGAVAEGAGTGVITRATIVREDRQVAAAKTAAAAARAAIRMRLLPTLRTAYRRRPKSFHADA